MTQQQPPDPQRVIQHLARQLVEAQLQVAQLRALLDEHTDHQPREPTEQAPGGG